MYPGAVSKLTLIYVVGLFGTIQTLFPDPSKHCPASYFPKTWDDKYLPSFPYLWAVIESFLHAKKNKYIIHCGGGVKVSKARNISFFKGTSTGTATWRLVRRNSQFAQRWWNGRHRKQFNWKERAPSDDRIRRWLHLRAYSPACLVAQWRYFLQVKSDASHPDGKTSMFIGLLKQTFSLAS